MASPETHTGSTDEHSEASARAAETREAAPEVVETELVARELRVGDARIVLAPSQARLVSPHDDSYELLVFGPERRSDSASGELHIAKKLGFRSAQEASETFANIRSLLARGVRVGAAIEEAGRVLQEQRDAVHQQREEQELAERRERASAASAEYPGEHARVGDFEIDVCWVGQDRDYGYEGYEVYITPNEGSGDTVHLSSDPREARTAFSIACAEARRGTRLHQILEHLQDWRHARRVAERLDERES